MKYPQHSHSRQPLRSFRSSLLAPTLVLALVATVVAAPVSAQPSACDLTQVTSSATQDSFAGGLSANGRFLSLTSRADHTGGNPDGSRELFLYDRTSGQLTQLTDLAEGYVHSPVMSADGARVFFRTNVDPATGDVMPSTQELLVELDRASGVQTVLAGNFADLAVSADGSSAALLSGANPTGGNGDGNEEVFLLDLGTGDFVQITDTLQAPCSGLAPRCPSQLVPRIDADGSRVAFLSDYDLDGSGAGTTHGGIFVYDVAAETLTRATANADPELVLSDDGATVAFASYENLVAGSVPGATLELFLRSGASGFVRVPDLGTLDEPVALDRTGSRLLFNAVPQVGNGRDAFLFDEGTGGSVQLLAAPGVDDFAVDLTPDGAWASLHSKVNLAGGNPDGGFEVFLAACAEEAVPAPPDGPWLQSPAVPGFRFKVRITAGGQVQPVRLESDCIPETACVSGALEGRSELFVRVVGPRLNDKLWPILVRFSTSRIEVWIEQLSSNDLQYYVLDEATPGSSDLTGLFDRDGFDP
jgi:Tol biopolymer transport system component